MNIVLMRRFKSALNGNSMSLHLKYLIVNNSLCICFVLVIFNQMYNLVSVETTDFFIYRIWRTSPVI